MTASDSDTSQSDSSTPPVDSDDEVQINAINEQLLLLAKNGDLELGGLNEAGEQLFRLTQQGRERAGSILLGFLEAEDAAR